MDRCPCGSGHTYPACCQPYLTDRTQPASPEALMRSRYSAFCTGQIDYLIATLHPSQRRADDRQTLAQTIASTTWVGLRVLQSEVKGHMGSVEFVAFYRQASTLGQLHERSTFLRQAGRWYYLRGEMLPPIMLGRNDL